MKRAQRMETRSVSHEIQVKVEQFEFDPKEIADILWAHVMRQGLGTTYKIHGMRCEAIDSRDDYFDGVTLEVVTIEPETES